MISNDEDEDDDNDNDDKEGTDMLLCINTVAISTMSSRINVIQVSRQVGRQPGMSGMCQPPVAPRR